jgi:hypothetical protein
MSATGTRGPVPSAHRWWHINITVAGAHLGKDVKFNGPPEFRLHLPRFQKVLQFRRFGETWTSGLRKRAIVWSG